MKKITHLVFLLSFLSACTMPVNQAQAPDGSGQSQATATQIPTDLQAEFATEGAALPLEINAPLIDGPSIISIEMIDTVNGWGITNTQIVRTNDGGVTWYNVTPPDIAETGYSVATQFLDATHAWLQFPDPNNYPNGGTMYRTSDGGITWSSNATPFSSGEISFIDSNNGWMMADLGVGAGSMAVSVFQTADGGVTWNRTFTNDPNIEGAGDSLPLGGLKYGLTATNMQTAWIYGVTYSTGSAYLFRTDDAGKTWILVPMELSAEAQGAELSVEKVQFESAMQGTIVMRITGPKIRMVIYQTNDGGATWIPASATVPGGGSVDVVSAQEIIFYGTDQFHVTKDASSTWDIISPDVVFGESMISMDFATSSVGWVITSDPATSHSTLYKTEDGGTTWFPVIP